MPQVSLTTLVEGICSGDRLASFPTDTVPALAARPDRAELIFVAKQRDLNKSLILMGADVTDLWQYVVGSPKECQIWQQIADRYLPGALTLVLPASRRVPPTMNPKDPSTIGIRVPDHPIAQAVLRQTGALATTSANRSGQPPLQTVAEIEAQFPDVLTLLPSEIERLHPHLSHSASFSISGVPSTVAQWTGETWKILRQGSVDLRA